MRLWISASTSHSMGFLKEGEESAALEEDSALPASAISLVMLATISLGMVSPICACILASSAGSMPVLLDCFSILVLLSTGTQDGFFLMVFSAERHSAAFLLSLVVLSRISPRKKASAMLFLGGVVIPTPSAACPFSLPCSSSLVQRARRCSAKVETIFPSCQRTCLHVRK